MGLKLGRGGLSALSPFYSQLRTLVGSAGTAEKCHNRTHATQQTSGRAFPAVSFGYLSVECPFNKFYGINCRAIHRLGSTGQKNR